MRIAGFSDLILVNLTDFLAYRLPIRDDVVFGRSSQCDIVLKDATIGRRHGRLHVKGDRVEIIDHGATTGIFVNGNYAQQTALQVGDHLHIGRLEFRVEPIDWLGGGPPRTGSLDAETARERMIASFVHAKQPALSDATRDDIWWSLYADWWVNNGSERLFEDAWRLWTDAALRELRRGFSDQPRWFLAYGYPAFDALVSHTGLGELLGFDLLMSTDNDVQRQHAERRLESRASVSRRSLVDYMLSRLDTDMVEAPRFLGHILHRAMQDRAPFKLGRIRELANTPALTDVMASVVFVTFDRPEAMVFRVDANELLTIDAIGTARDAERIRVARAEDLDVRAWAEELASHEIVQPFAQL